MLTAIKQFAREDSGLETVEWAIVGGLVVAVCAAFFITMGGHASTAIGALQTQTAAAAS